MRKIHTLFPLTLVALIVLLFIYALPTQVRASYTLQMRSDGSVQVNIDAQNTPQFTASTPSDTPEPTRAPRPTPTPIPVPPPSNPNTTQMMVIFGILVVVVVIFGLWLNRKRIF